MFGPLAKNELPEQNIERILLLARRWEVSARALRLWAEGESGVIVGAKECVDFFEGRQWTAAQIADLTAQGRLPLKYNKINRLVRLVLGYQRNNKMETNYLPSADALSNMDVAEVLNLIAKQLSKANGLEYVDAEVFLDGIVSGRGYYDTRLNWEKNDFGDIVTRAQDPFTVYPDAEADGYELSTGNHISTSRWVSIDEAEWMWGKKVAELLRPYTAGHAWNGFPSELYPIQDEVTPLRYFNQEEDLWSPYGGFRDLFENEFVDPYRKNLRVIDMQHHITKTMDVFVDLETGDRAPVPEDWTQDEVQRALYHAHSVGNPLQIFKRPVKRVRWSTLVGDVLVYDKWSMYDTFTLTGYFPYFRRGFTAGMVNDLVDPQREVNKRRVARLDIVTRTANSGWLIDEESLSNEQEENLNRFGAMAGIIIKYKDGKKPEKIDPSPPPMAMERLEDDNSEDMQLISGINESAMGDIDSAQLSGKAIEARQRQAVIAIQMYMDNFGRSKELVAGKELANIQRHYTEERIVRSMGDDGRMIEKVINQRAGQNILNDVTRGKYTTTIDQQPLSATFASAQFDEMLLLVDKLQLPASVIGDILIDMSTAPRKEEIKQRMQAVIGIQPTPDPMGGTAIQTGVVPALPAPGAPPPANVVPMQPAAAQG